MNQQGVGLLANDDGLKVDGAAYLQLASLAAGKYFIAISSFGNEPMIGAGILGPSPNEMFPAYDPWESLYGPYTDAPLSFWSGGGALGDYNITFRYSTVPVPEPATMFFLGIGLVGLVGISLKRKKSNYNGQKIPYLIEQVSHGQ